MSTLATILNTLVVILAVLLIALILVQPSKSGGGFGSAFGGLGESVFGAQAMSHLSKLTVWCISIFFVLTLASAIVAGHIRTADSSVVEGESSLMAGAGNAGASEAAPEAVKPAETPAEAVKPAETTAETAADAVKSAETASETVAETPAETPAVQEEKPASETQN